jgi:hypothetical protein
VNRLGTIREWATDGRRFEKHRTVQGRNRQPVRHVMVDNVTRQAPARETKELV